MIVMIDGFYIAQILASRKLNALAHTIHANIRTYIIYTHARARRARARTHTHTHTHTYTHTPTQTHIHTYTHVD